MASKRMFSKKIIDSDAFLDMPLSTQALYFHLSMRADDEGFVNNVKKIMRMIGSANNEIQILISKRFIIEFGNGVVVIKHWKIHNCIRLDRVKKTVYQEELNSLATKENGSYTEKCLTSDGQVTDKCPHRLEEIRLEEISIKESGRFAPPTLEEVSSYCLERKNGIDAQAFIDYYETRGWKLGKTKMKSWKAAVRTWEKRSNKHPMQQQKWIIQ